MGDARKSLPNLTVLLKYFLLIGGLTALVIVAGLNIWGHLNLSMTTLGYTFLMVFAVSFFALSLHVFLKALLCFLVSLWTDKLRKAVNFRLLLLECYGWVDFDDWRELGVLTLVPLVLFFVPVFLAAFAPFGFSYYLVYGPTVNNTGDTAGLGGQSGSFAKLLTSIELLPNETRRVLSSDHPLQPRFFCKSTVTDGTVYNSTVAVPSWPYPEYNHMGDQGQRVTIGPVEGFAFNSSCTTGPPRFDTRGVVVHPLDSGDAPPALTRAGQRLDSTLSVPNISLSFYQDYRGPYYGNLTCMSTVKRAQMSATWTINSTGYYLEGCSNVSPYSFTRSSVDLFMVDNWLNLTTRNTLKNIAFPVWAVAQSSSDAAQDKVIVSLVHLVAWLYASSRTGDPTHDSTTGSNQAREVSYAVEPINAYYTTNSAVFALLLAVDVLLIVSLVLRFVDHGFHGGSMLQIFLLCKDIYLQGWRTDLFPRSLGRASTDFNVALNEDDNSFQLVDSATNHPQNGDDLSRRPPSVLDERDFSDVSRARTFAVNSSSDLLHSSQRAGTVDPEDF